MTRLPTPGGDTGNWGTILNEYLSTVHNVDGSLKPGVVAGSHLADGSITTDKLADASITTTKLASSVQTTLSSVVTTSSLGVAGGIASLDSSGKVPASQLPIASGGTVPVATASVSGTIQLTGDLGGSASSPTVTKLSGVSLSGTPSAGQALVATSSSSAGWQTVSTGGATNPNAGTVWNTTTDPASGSTASSVKDGDMWVDGSTDPTKVLLKARVSGQWVVTAELTKPTVTTTSPPQASVNPTVTDTSVTLSWTAPSQVAGTLDGYNVYEGSSTTPLNTALIPASTTSFTTTTPLTPGTSYNFVIKAVSTPTGGSQTESAGLTIQATTTGTVVNPLPAPTGVTATAGNATASVAFNLVTGATSYTVTATPGGINKIGSTSPITVDGLANGTSYTFTVSATDGTRTSAESTASGAVVPSGGGSSGIYPAEVKWLSGMCDQSASQGATMGFGDWRGEPIRYVTAWDGPTDNSLGALTEYLNAGYAGVLHSSKHAPDGYTWTAAANGNYDSFFNTYADTLVAKTGSMKEIHAGFGFEMNGSWFACSIVHSSQGGASGGQLAMLPNVTAGWQRYANIIRSKATAANKNVKICLNLTWDTHGDASVRQIVNAVGLNNFDYLGVDYYDAYKPTANNHLTNQSEWDTEYTRTKHNGDSPVGLGAWVAFAESIGKPMTFPEWGPNDNRSQGPYDNPFYVQKMNEFFNSIKPADPGVPQAGKVYGEAYFNSEEIGYIWPNTALPNLRDKYLELSWGQ